MINNYKIINYSNGTILFHVPTSSIHKITDDVAQNLYSHPEKYPEILELESRPIINPRNSNNKSDKRLGTLSFLSSTNCNLKCKYCFANEGSYNEELGRNMTIEQYKKTLANILEKYPNGIKNISFFGGEPLLNFKQIKEFTDYCYSLFMEKGLEIPKFGLTTNGTLLTDEIIDFFEKYNFVIGVSIDGNKEINDNARISKIHNSSVYDKVIKNLDNEKVLNRNFRLTVQSTINKFHIQKYRKGIIKEWLEEMKNLNIYDIAFLPVCTDDDDLKINEDDKLILGKILDEYVEFWFDLLVKDSYSDVSFIILGYIKDIVFGGYCEDCGVYNQIFVNADGDMYPCHFFYHDRNLKLGNVNTLCENLDEKVLLNLKSCTRKSNSTCNTCLSRNLCSLWCRGENMMLTKDTKTIGREVRCWAQNSLVESIIVNLVKIREDEEKYNNLTKNIIHCKNKYEKLSI